MPPQNDLVLGYMKRTGSITPVEAFTELGIYRLGARIYDLRAQGHNINRTTPANKIARYVLIKEKRQ